MNSIRQAGTILFDASLVGMGPASLVGAGLGAICAWADGGMTIAAGAAMFSLGVRCIAAATKVMEDIERTYKVEFGNNLVTVIVSSVMTISIGVFVLCDERAMTPFTFVMICLMTVAWAVRYYYSRLKG